MSFLNTNKPKCGLVIGINYTGKTGAELNGCINDTERVCKFLKERCGYQEENIQLLTDNTSIKPTKQNIINAIHRLIQQVKEKQAKEVWFSYSGHGSYTYGAGGYEEADGQDEALVPLDYDTQGLIKDDTLYDILVKRLPLDCHLFSIVDACHSGTSLDLPFLYRIDTGIKLQRPSEELANIIKMSGCRDSQTSADAYINGKYQGAMTFSFLKCMEELDYSFTPQQLVQRCKHYLNTHGYPQIPTMTFSKQEFLNDIIMGDSHPLLQNATINLYLEGDAWCNSESSWNILSMNENKLLFERDRRFQSRNEKINYQLNLSDGRYILLLKDSYGDGGIKGNLKYLNTSVLIKSFNFSKGTYQSIDFEVNHKQVEESKKKEVTINLQGDYYCESESKWNIIDSLGYSVFPEDKVFSQRNENQNMNVKLEPGKYKLKLMDTYGDGGISGDIYHKTDEHNILKFKWENLDWKKHNGYLQMFDFEV